VRTTRTSSSAFFVGCLSDYGLFDQRPDAGLAALAARRVAQVTTP
jgi:hypothetical protein